MSGPRSTQFRFVSCITDPKAATPLYLYEGKILAPAGVGTGGSTRRRPIDRYGNSSDVGEGHLVIDTVLQRQVRVRSSRPSHTEQLTPRKLDATRRRAQENKVTIETTGPPAVHRDIHATLMEDADLMEYICQENNQYGVAGEYSNPFQTPAR